MNEQSIVPLGVCMAVRDFECLLCGQPFSRLSGDLILPTDHVCDKCLAGLEHLGEKDLWAYIDQNRIDSREKRDP